ncbi:MAG: enolase C-terminal domain-like protein [Succinivibrionaceae bacterium]
MYLGLYRYDLPLTKPFFLQNQFLTVRSGLLIRSGNFWGEICPLKGFSEETLEEAQAEALLWMKSKVQHQDYQLKLRTVQFGVDCMNAHFSYDTSLFSHNGLKYKLLIGKPKQILFDWFQLIDNYPEYAKINVAQYSLKDELRLIKEICKKAPNIKLIIDASCSWTREEALTIINHLSRDNLFYIEDPCSSLEDTIYISRLTGIPIAVDHLLQRYSLSQCCQIPTIKAVVIKPSFLGRIQITLGLFKECKMRNIEPIFGTAFESQVGTYNIRLIREMCGKKFFFGINPDEMFKESIFKPGTTEVDEDKLTVIQEYIS